eukprot:8298458-Pyramimonas_sp.AAC.2
MQNIPHPDQSDCFRRPQAASLALGSVYAPFARVSALHASPYTEAAWKAAVHDYERRMEPIETRISQVSPRAGRANSRTGRAAPWAKAHMVAWLMKKGSYPTDPVRGRGIILSS